MKKIIVVDDEPDVIRSIKEGLRNDFEIKGADSGKQLFKTLESSTPDLILLDIMMPEMSGWETFNKLKGNASWGKIPVVFITARTDRIAKNAGGFLGDDYIEKPFDADYLKGRIDKILKKR